MYYQVVLVPSDEGFAVGCPTLPGCWSQGETEEESLENIREAIREYLLAREELLMKQEQGARLVEVVT